jgi:hypothetical protein
LIPYFGDKFVTSIDYEELQRFAKWRPLSVVRVFGTKVGLN